MAGMTSRTRDVGILSLVTIAPIWGYSWVVSKVALDDSRPLTFIAISLAGCVGFLFLVLLVTRRSLRPPPLGWVAVIGLLQTTLFSGLATVALDVGGAGKVTVLVYTMPFWLLVLARLFLGERLRGLQVPAVALAFAGLVLVVRPWDIGGALSGALACAAGVAWAAASLLVKLLQRRSPVDAISLAAWQMAFGCLPLIAAAALTDPTGPNWTATFVGCVAYTMLLSNGLGWVLWVFALRALLGGRRRPGHAGRAGDRRRRRVAPARRGADARGGHRHAVHSRRTRGAGGEWSSGRRGGRSRPRLA